MAIESMFSPRGAYGTLTVHADDLDDLRRRSKLMPERAVAYAAGCGGSLGAVDESRLAGRVTDLRRAWKGRDSAVDAFAEFLRTADDWALFRINPYRWGAENHLAEDESLELFLHGG